MWIAKRIYLKEEGLKNTEKHQLMDEALFNIVFPFVDDLLDENKILKWYCSRNWEDTEVGMKDSSVRVYLDVEKDIVLYVENNFADLVEEKFSTILKVEVTPVDETLVTLPFIQKGCEVAKTIMMKFPEWDRQLNRNCYNEVVNEVDKLKNSMEGFTVKQKNQAAHFILQNVLFLENPPEMYGTPASWEIVMANKEQFSSE